MMTGVEHAILVEGKIWSWLKTPSFLGGQHFAVEFAGQQVHEVWVPAPNPVRP